LAKTIFALTNNQHRHESRVKTIALQMPEAAAPLDAMPLESSLNRLVTRLRDALARAGEGAMQLSDTERLVRDAQALRAAFLRGSR
jgi:hypothetical protein